MRPDPANWYVLIGDQETGPLTRVELGVELATGVIAAGSLVWREGMTGWLPGVNVPEVESLFRNPPRSPRAAGARLQDLEGSRGARALVPKRIAPRVAEPQVALPGSPSDEELVPEATIVDEQDGADAHVAALSSWAVSEMQRSAKHETPPAVPKKKSLPPPPVPAVRRPPPEQSWASLAIRHLGRARARFLFALVRDVGGLSSCR